MLWTFLQVNMTLTVVIHNDHCRVIFLLLRVQLERFMAYQVLILFDYFYHEKATFSVAGPLAHPCL